LAPKYDLLIRGGTLVDPAHGLHAVRDIAISGDRIAAVAAEIPEAEAQTVIDALCTGQKYISI
jgi:dihydroorotase